MSHLQIITTSDGSHSLLNTRLNETYHSVHGAIQESNHVFIKNGLAYFVQQNSKEEIDILEIGFGTGLNALLTLQYALQKNIRVRYTTLETDPLPFFLWSQLNYGDTEESRKHFNSIHEAVWEKEDLLLSPFRILKLNTSLQDVELTSFCDVVYFDAFAPNKQPEMWELPVLKKVTDNLKVNGCFVTYCAKGQLKRDLRDLGLKVATLPGPPGKNEMVRALKV